MDENSRHFVNNMVESAVRIGLIFILIYGTFYIVKPFVLPVAWGGIIAVALSPLVDGLVRRLKLKNSQASLLVTLICIALLIVPFAMVTNSIYSGLLYLSEHFNVEEIQNYSPNEAIKTWPLIGEKIYDGMTYTLSHLREILIDYLPQIKDVITTALSTFGSGVASLLMFIISFIIAGVFNANSEGITKSIVNVFDRVTGDQGQEWAQMTTEIIRSVLVGVIGVAVIQSLIISAAVFTFNIPGAGIISVAILILCIAQLPAILAIIPLIGYMYLTADTTAFVIFTIWAVIAGLSDNVLKPILMGRGSSVPMPLIVIGSLGGMMYAGIIGLFIGAVVLALWWGAFKAWMGSPKAVIDEVEANKKLETK